MGMGLVMWKAKWTEEVESKDGGGIEKSYPLVFTPFFPSL